MSYTIPHGPASSLKGQPAVWTDDGAGNAKWYSFAQLKAALDAIIPPVPAPTPVPTPAPVPTPTPTPSPAPFADKLGIYCGNNGDPSSQAALIGLPRFPFYMSFVNGANPTSMITSGDPGVQDAVLAKPAGARLIFPLNMLPDTSSGVTASSVLSGAMDATVTFIAKYLVANGDQNAIIRIGWEFNGNWFPWGTQAMSTAQFLAIWARYVGLMRAVPGQQFEFFWNPTLDLSKDLTAYLPPASEIDYIGVDLYDQTASPWPGPQAAWQQYLNAPCGLNWIASTAKIDGKKIILGEVGDGYNAGANGGDDAYFWQQVGAWALANPVECVVLWCDPNSGVPVPSTKTPLSTAAVKALVV